MKWSRRSAGVYGILACLGFFITRWAVSGSDARALPQLDRETSGIAVSKVSDDPEMSALAAVAQDAAARVVRQAEKPPRGVSEGVLPPSDEAWGRLERGNQDPARLFALAPVAIRADLLIRNVHLNPCDQYVDPVTRAVFADYCRERVAAIEFAVILAGRNRHKLLSAMHEMGRLMEVSEQLLGPEKWAVVVRGAQFYAIQRSSAGLPDIEDEASRRASFIMNNLRKLVGPTSGFLRYGNTVFVAGPIATLDEDKNFVQYLKDEFFLECLTVFQRMGALPASEFDSINRRYFDLNRPASNKEK